MSTPPEEPLLKPCSACGDEGCCECTPGHCCECEIRELKKSLAKSEAESRGHFENAIRLVGENERIKAKLEDMREKFRLMIQQDHGSCFRLQAEKEAEIARLKESIRRMDEDEKNDHQFAQDCLDQEKQIQQQAEIIRIAREKLVGIQGELGVPSPHYAQPVANAWYLAGEALDKMNRVEGK